MHIHRPKRSGWSLIELIAVVAILAVLAGLVMAGVQRVRAAAAGVQCANNLRQIGLALHSHHGGHQYLPRGVTSEGDASGQPFMSWCARLLPHLEQDALWKSAVAAYTENRNFLYDPPHTGLATPVAVFGCPLDARVASASRVTGTTGRRAFTSYLGVIGVNPVRADGVLFYDSAVKLGDVTDGTSNTLAVGERPPSANLVLGWWYAGWGQDKDGDADMILGVRAKNNGRYGKDCPPGPYHFTAGKVSKQCDAFHFWSLHSGGATFLFADGSVRFLAYTADPIMPALASRAGGEAVTLD